MGRIIAGLLIIASVLAAGGYYLSRSSEWAVSPGRQPVVPEVTPHPLPPHSGESGRREPEAKPIDRPESGPEPWLVLESPPVPPPRPAPKNDMERAVLEAIARYPEERAALLEELESETVETLLRKAHTLMPADAFARLQSRGPLVEDVQRYLLQDPRFATLLHAAVHGTAEERRTMLDTTHQVLDRILHERALRRAGEVYDHDWMGAGIGVEIYPMLLAELDTSGESLPLLVEWYFSELGGKTGENGRALLAQTGSEPAADVLVLPPMSGTMFMVASATRRIYLRTVEEGSAWGEVEAPPVFSGGRWGVPALGALNGYALLGGMEPPDCWMFMDFMRESLEI